MRGLTASRSAGGTGSTSRSSTRPGGQDLVEQHAHRDPPERHPPPAAEPVEQRVDALDREVAAARLQPVGRRVTRRQHEPPARPEHAAHLRQQAHAVVDVVVHERHHRAVERRVVEHRQRTFEVVLDELDVGADTGTGPRELLRAPVDADDIGTPADELGEVVARPASDVGEPQPVDLTAEIEHRGTVVVRVVEAILGLRVPPLGHLVVDRGHVADDRVLGLRVREPLHRRCELASCRGSRRIGVLGTEVELDV